MANFEVNNEQRVPVYSGDVQKELQALQCQEAFSVVAFEQKLRERHYNSHQPSSVLAVETIVKKFISSLDGMSAV